MDEVVPLATGQEVPIKSAIIVVNDNFNTVTDSYNSDHRELNLCIN